MNEDQISIRKDSALSPLKQAFLALEQAQARIHELEEACDAPIAIVGMGCRIPSAMNGIDDYWKLLIEQKSAVSDGVEWRFADSLQGKALPKSARHAALLDRVDQFDPRHFGISPREAVGMDPQQRLLLEVSWEALENAGIAPSKLYQSATGVYVGLSSHDYAQLQLRAGEAQAINPHFASGVAASVAAGRISYVLGANGPCITIDTACSSSLVAVHLACEALRRGECAMALAGGVNLILSPEPSIAFAQAGMLSESGVCRAFDAGANGFVRGEGCGIVVLKPLAQAKQAGDRILAVINGSAVNQDGASSGLTVPNGLAQQGLLREAHRRAGIEAWQVGYVEAHGTGTVLGDPIEAEALGVVFGQGRPQDRSLLLGSVKSNVGHLEAAAGVAGLMKLVLALQSRTVPGQLNWNHPSEHVRWSELPLEIPTEARPWEPIAGRRIGGVSSFGFSGTNAHIVVEEWSPEERNESSLPKEDVLVLTARTDEALRELVGRYSEFLSRSNANWNDVCYTAASGRAALGERLAIVAGDKQEAARKLLNWTQGAPQEGVYRGQVGSVPYEQTEALTPDTAPSSVAAQFVRGFAIDWAARAGRASLRKVALPTYPFQRERYWIESTKRPNAESGTVTGRPMLGRRLRSAGVRAQFETSLTAASWIGEHVVQGQVLLPATGHVELMLEAASESCGSAFALEDVVLQAPLAIDGERRAQTVLEDEVNGRYRVRLYAEQANSEWQRVSEAWISTTRSQVSERLNLQRIRERLRTHKAGSDFYTQLALRRLTFGSRFRGVQEVWIGDGEALAEIALMECNDADWELIPWWLDACLQVAETAASGDGEDSTQLYLPLSVQRIEVFGRPAEQSWSHIMTQRVDSDTLAAEVTVADSSGLPLVRFSHMRFRRITNKAEDINSWMYRLDWQRAELTDDSGKEAILQGSAGLDARIDELGSTDRIVEYNDFFGRLEELSATYVLDTFCRLGWPASDSIHDAEALQHSWKIAPQHRRLLRRMLEIAVEMGAVQRDGDKYRFGDALSVAATYRSAKLAEQFSIGKTELDLVNRCGQSLAEVLTGRLDGRDLVFPGGQSEEMARLYGDSLPARIYNQMLAESVARIVSNRGGARTRILEVGGGTGATTKYVLEALGSAGEVPSEYLFTDISPLLVKRASQTFQNTAYLHTKVFDLEGDGSEQGIEGPFSIVLAVNVLHATTDLSATLTRLKPLLAEDGVLMMVEVTGKQRWADITVGLLDGWWSFSDHDLRTEYPTLQSGAWCPVLEGAGFTCIVTIPHNQHRQSIFARQELIFASVSSRPKRIVIVGEGKLADTLSQQLRAQSAFIECVPNTDFAERLLSDAKIDAVVWLAGHQAAVEQAPAGTASSLMQNALSSLLMTAQALLTRSVNASPRLYIVTAGAFAVEADDSAMQLAATSLAGLATGIATEAPQLRCTRLDCSAEESDMDAANIAAEVLANTESQWVAWRAGARTVAKLRRLQSAPGNENISERVRLTSGIGIDSLEYVQAPSQDLKPAEVEIAVRATGVNFRDVLQSMGALPPGSPLGTDCAGTILRVGKAVVDLAAGDEVVAIAPGCFATHAVTQRALIVRKPGALSFTEATAQSVAYLTADYCLNEVAHVRKGERVLIHAAAGGVGLAAVHLCRRTGAVPIVTAGSERKRAFLRDLGIEHVYDSRSLDFSGQIAGGVDIVINSLAGEAIEAGLGLLKPGGRFIELGKTALRDPVIVEQDWRGAKYLPVDLTPLFLAASPWVAERLAALLNDIAQGSLPRLPANVFDSVETKHAFRYMARAEHIGRVVVERKKIRNFSGSHLVTGGLRGIGLKLAEWLAANGADELVLVGRRPPAEGSKQVFALMESKGVVVRTIEGDIADAAVAVSAVANAGNNLQGVWHCAGLLENASIGKQSWSIIEKVLRPKVDGAWNLHLLTRNLPIESFVLFSSWASIAGSHGQANHCAANAFLDGLAHFRRGHGLPALSVNWGAWGEIGSAAGAEVRRQLARAGIESMSPDSALDALRVALRTRTPQCAIAAIDWLRFLDQNAGDRSLYSELLAERNLRPPVAHGNTVEPERRPTKSAPIGSSLEAILALSPSMREPALSRTIADIVRRTLDLHDGEEIDPDAPLSDLGMDSLLAIELRNSLSVVLLRQFPSTILFDYPTLRTLASYLSSEVFPREQTRPGTNGSTLRAAKGGNEDSLTVLEMIEQLSDEEVESRLDGEFRAGTVTRSHS
jgi:acyl transferase domain-containing protein/NAD(P)-dependent dehydrogenase (short-subunit alcohol dehydrogenase family)/SAM-dependent methyltransferase/acyl carrier protein